MKRSVWALTALLGGTVGLAHADYVLIRINLGVQQPKLPGPPVIGQPALPVVTPPPPKGIAPAPIDRSNQVSVIALVEYGKSFAETDPANKQVKRIAIDHRWGRSEVVIEPKEQPVKVFESLWYNKKQTPAYKFEEAHKNLLTAKDKSAVKYLELAEFALTNGLPNKVPEVLAELKKLDLSNDKDAARAKSVLDAMELAAQGLLKTPSRDDIPVAWRISSLKSDSLEHYTLYFNSPGGGVTPESKQRLARLEDNCRAFYFWFVLRGIALPAPERRQVAILLEKPMEFNHYKMAFGGPATVADGCYAARENVAVFSAVPLDDSYELISRQFKNLMQDGWNFKTLLKYDRPKGKTNEEIAHAQTMALISKAIHEESEIASVSHHGSRQMLTASGILPRNVVLPQWLNFGFPAVFETPKFSRETQTGAFWPTYGAPSWVYLIQWKDWEREKALDPPEQALLDVIGDVYHRRVSKDPSQLFKARTMAWSLAYFLAQRHLDGLLRYCRELGQLPRDLELDDDIYRACFLRAFGLEGPSGINQAKFGELAKEWYSFIGITPPPQYQEMLKDAQILREQMKKPAAKQ